MSHHEPVPKKILLFGATGVIGKYILASLVANKSSFDKIGFFTSPNTLQHKGTEIGEWKNKGVFVEVGDVESERDLKRAFEGYDTIISALGRSVILHQIPLITLASKTPNIHTFYPSEYGTDIEYNTTTSPTEKPHQLKLRVRKHITDTIHPQDLKITYLVTGPYSDLYIAKNDADPEFRKAGSIDAQGLKATLLGTGKEDVSFTTMKDVGGLLVAALKTPVGDHDSPRTLKVNSFTATPDQILEEFQRQTGTGPGDWNVEYTSLEELKGLEAKAWKEGDPYATGFTLRRIWTEGGTLYEERDNGKIGEPGTESLVEQVRKALEKQSKAARSSDGGEGEVGRGGKEGHGKASTSIIGGS